MVPLMESLAERCPTTRALLHSSIEVPGIWAPSHIPGSPRMERGPHGERCPYPEPFLTYIRGSPVRKLPRGPLQRGFAHFISSETALFKASRFGALCDEALWLHEVFGFAKYHRCYGTRGYVVVLAVGRNVRCTQSHVAEFGRCGSVDSSCTVLIGAIPLCYSIFITCFIQSQLNIKI